ncbi:thyrotropin-releasing hormone receptor-like [Tubulanus polymorphus]|uniref:thyrotropin-releasing hormone receptor-like n=1 Tax=Tubulanus polymorphus TaxID=672921 RepID=UPI003DA2332A
MFSFAFSPSLNKTTAISKAPAKINGSDVGIGDTEPVYEIILFKYVGFVIFLMGIIGNTLTVIVITRNRSLKRCSTGLMLVVLAISDNGALVTGPLMDWINISFNIELQDLNYISCKLKNVAQYFFLQFSSWMIILISIERFVSVYYPTNAKQWFTLKKTYIKIFAIFIALLLLNSHFLWTYDINGFEDYCDIVDRYSDFIFLAWGWIDFTVYSLIPWIVLTITNIAIIIRLRQMKNKVSVTPSVTKLRKSSITSEESMISLTVMLIVVNIALLFTTTPLSIFLLIDKRTLGISREQWNMLHGYLTILAYLNNAINFLLYVVSGARFRSAFFEMFRRKNDICGS